LAAAELLRRPWIILARATRLGHLANTEQMLLCPVFLVGHMCAVFLRGHYSGAGIGQRLCAQRPPRRRALSVGTRPSLVPPGLSGCCSPLGRLILCRKKKKKKTREREKKKGKNSALSFILVPGLRAWLCAPNERAGFRLVVLLAVLPGPSRLIQIRCPADSARAVD